MEQIPILPRLLGTGYNADFDADISLYSDAMTTEDREWLAKYIRNEFRDEKSIELIKKRYKNRPKILTRRLKRHGE
jgi:hypothetical protein